jgi:hypothetical protein
MTEDLQMVERNEWVELCQAFLDKNGVKHFSPLEIADVGREANGYCLEAPALSKLKNALPLIRVLEWLREYDITAPVLINSWYRDRNYNRSIGGVSRSMHLTLGACDIVKIGFTPRQVALALQMHPQSRTFGIGRYDNFTHLDVRGQLGMTAPARW